MLRQNKQATIAEIFIVCVLMVAWFVLNKVDSWFFQENFDYVAKILATPPIAISIEEGNHDLFDGRLAEAKVIKTHVLQLRPDRAVRRSAPCNGHWALKIWSCKSSRHLSNPAWNSADSLAV